MMLTGAGIRATIAFPFLAHRPVLLGPQMRASFAYRYFNNRPRTARGSHVTSRHEQREVSISGRVCTPAPVTTPPKVMNDRGDQSCQRRWPSCNQVPDVVSLR